MVGYPGRNPQETFLRSLMGGRPRLQRSELEPELAKLFDGTYQMMMGRDLSLEPEIFGKRLIVRGIFLYKKRHHWFSQLIATVSFEVILFNEIDLQNVSIPPGFIRVRLRDLQEFPYTAAIRIFEK